jgi:hypothetical protein
MHGCNERAIQLSLRWGASCRSSAPATCRLECSIPGPVRRVGIGSITEHTRANGETALGASVGGAIGTGMTDQRHDYRGYRIDIRRPAGGLRATIYAPDSKRPMCGPQSDDPTDHNEILNRAKGLSPTESQIAQAIWKFLLAATREQFGSSGDSTCRGEGCGFSR